MFFTASFDDTKQMRLIIRSDSMAVRQALRRILTQMNQCNMSQETTVQVEIVLAEVLNNVIKHAYQDRPDGAIELQLSCESGGTLRCEIIDDGLAMPHNRVPSGEIPNLNCPTNDLPEGGFGWHMIRDLTQDLDYCRREHRNHLRFQLALCEDPRKN